MISMRGRKSAVWLGVILAGATAVVLLLNEISILSDNVVMVVGALFFVSLIVTGWRLKRGLKKRMERGLQRSVSDEELTSISAWMKIPDQAARAAREAEKYDFDD
jgi:hypothetical protein